jgi:hypothetical protein
MGCGASSVASKSDFYPETPEDVLVACRTGKLSKIRKLVENDRTNTIFDHKRVGRGYSRVATGQYFCIYDKKKNTSWEKDAPKYKWEIQYRVRVGFGAAIAEAGAAGQTEIVDYLLEVGEAFDIRVIARRLLRDEHLETMEKAYRKWKTLDVATTNKRTSTLMSLVESAVADDQPGAVRMLRSEEPELSLPVSLLGKAKSLPVLRELLADPRLDPSADETKIISAIAQRGTYAMLRTVVADPRVLFEPEAAGAVFSAVVRGPDPSVKRLRFILQRLPSEHHTWEFFHDRWEMACRNAGEDVVRWLFRKLREKRTKETKLSETRLATTGAHSAVLADNAPALKFLLSQLEQLELAKQAKQADDMGYHNTLLRACCGLAAPSPQCLEVLLDSRFVDPAAGDNDAFMIACRNGNASAVERLLADPRVDPRAQDSKGIKEANERGHREVVRLILADVRANPGPAPEYDFEDSPRGKGKEEVDPPPTYGSSDDSYYSISYR